jgi:hypothetical protein
MGDSGVFRIPDNGSRIPTRKTTRKTRTREQGLTARLELGKNKAQRQEEQERRETWTRS